LPKPTGKLAVRGKLRYDEFRAMKRGFALLLFLTSAAFAQVTLVSPEEAKRALKNLPPAPRAAAPAPAASPAVPRLRRGSILPDSFGGWTGSAPQRFGQYNAAALVGDEAPLLLEYGYVGAERRRFTKGQQVLNMDAVRMKDSTGSYGLFTYYRGEDWDTRNTGKEHIGVRGGELLLRKDEVLVRASLAGGPDGPRLKEADLRELIAQLETDGGGPLPNLPLYLPESGLLPKSRKYILGPLAYSRLARNLPPELVDFEMGAEANLARYQLPRKPPMTLLLLSYPTSQLAAAKIKALQQTPALSENGPLTLFARRIGPLLSFVSGASSKTEADLLLERITYTADVTWNQPVEKNNEPTLGELIMNIVKLIGALFAFAFISGIAFGLIRVAVKKRYPNLVFDRPEDMEIIRLNITYNK